MKHLTISMALLSSVISFTGCDNNTKREDENDHSGHDHHEGMDHSKMEMPGNEKTHEMVVTLVPEKPAAGQEVKISTKPVKLNSQEVAALDLAHEKKVHMIIVSEDLSWFDHIHPEEQQDNYEIATRFPFGGDFVIFQDYKPTGATPQIHRKEMNVSGKEKEKVKYDAPKLNWEGNGYKVTLGTTSPQLKPNTSVNLKLNIAKGGKPVTDLNQYLGALAHLVIISEDTKEYLHVHPIDSKTNGPEEPIDSKTAGPDVKFHTEFPKAGIYRAFAQFDHNGKIHTADFVLKVD